MTVIDEAQTPVQTEVRHTMRILDRTGDTTITWEAGNAAEVQAARTHFDKLRGNGYLAYRVEDESRGTQLHRFDESAGEIIMSPAIQGG